MKPIHQMIHRTNAYQVKSHHHCACQLLRYAFAHAWTPGPSRRRRPSPVPPLPLLSRCHQQQRHHPPHRHPPARGPRAAARSRVRQRPRTVAAGARARTTAAALARRRTGRRAGTSRTARSRPAAPSASRVGTSRSRSSVAVPVVVPVGSRTLPARPRSRERAAKPALSEEAIRQKVRNVLSKKNKVKQVMLRPFPQHYSIAEARCVLSCCFLQQVLAWRWHGAGMVTLATPTLIRC